MEASIKTLFRILLLNLFIIFIFILSVDMDPYGLIFVYLHDLNITTPKCLTFDHAYFSTELSPLSVISVNCSIQQVIMAVSIGSLTSFYKIIIYFFPFSHYDVSCFMDIVSLSHLSATVFFKTHKTMYSLLKL